MNRRDLLILALSAISAKALTKPRSASAQSQYPDRPIRLIVPFAAGGVGDSIARLWADRMKALSITVIIENQGGASGMIGALDVARAQPDGYTMLFGNTSTQVLIPAIMSRPPYDPAKDFTAVGIVAKSAISVAVNPSLPAKNLQELVSYIKANPGKISYGTSGAGTFTNLAGEMFKKAADTPNLVHIPYKGGGPLAADVISGHVPMTMINITSQVIEFHKTGKMRVIAVFTPKRLAVLPDVQAAPEVFPDLIAALFAGIFAPAATPKPIIDQLARANRRAMESEDFQRKLADSGFEPVLDTPAEAQRYVESEQARVIPLVKSLGFKLQ